MFPEVDCFNSKLQLEHSVHCKQNGSPVLRHVLYPRYNAFTDICRSIKSWQIYLYDFTIVYWVSTDQESQFKVPRLLDLFWTNNQLGTWHVSVTVKRYPMVSMSGKKRKLESWLEKNWIRKDNRIHNTLFPMVRGNHKRSRGRFFLHKKI